jgi:hypothetical protein
MMGKQIIRDFENGDKFTQILRNPALTETHLFQRVYFKKADLKFITEVHTWLYTTKCNTENDYLLQEVEQYY